MKIYHTYTFDTPRPATLLRWGTHSVHSTMIPGEYVRLAPRTWAVWLGFAPSRKYIYHVPKQKIEMGGGIFPPLGFVLHKITS